MKTLKIKSHLQKNKQARQTIWTDNKYVTNGEFLFATNEVNLPNIQAQFMPNISTIISNLLKKRLEPVQPVINKANCCILDVHSYINPIYTHMLRHFLNDSNYKFYKGYIKEHITESLELEVSILYIYRGTEFVGLFYPTVCISTKKCRECNEM